MACPFYILNCQPTAGGKVELGSIDTNFINFIFAFNVTAYEYATKTTFNTTYYVKFTSSNVTSMIVQPPYPLPTQFYSVGAPALVIQQPFYTYSPSAAPKNVV